MSNKGVLARSVLSHLVVGLLPALILGGLLYRLGEQSLTHEVEQLHLAVASRIRDRLSLETERSFELLGQAERILSDDAIPLEQKRLLFQALVANGRIPYLALYTPSGQLDSSYGDRLTPAPGLPIDLLQIAQKNPPGLDTRDGQAFLIVLPWKRDNELWGFIVTAIELAPMRQLLSDLAGFHLGAQSSLEVADGHRTVLLSNRDQKKSGLFLALTGDWTATFSESGIGHAHTYEEDGEPWLGTLVSDARWRWVVGAGRPKSVALEALGKIRRRVFTLALAAALAAGLAGLLLARATSEPLRSFTRAVRETWRSGFRSDIAVPQGGELAELATAFNNAVHELKSHREQVQLRANLQVRLARVLSPSELHQVLSGSFDAPGLPRQALTVLYADLAGVTALDRSATGALMGLLADFFSAATASVVEAGGELDRFSGDVVIGVFYGDRHAEKAVRAATVIVQQTRAMNLRWKDQVGSEIAAAVGVSTGHTWLRREQTATGFEVSVASDVVERSATLQREARPGNIRVDAVTRAALGDKAGMTSLAGGVGELAPEAP